MQKKLYKPLVLALAALYLLGLYVLLSSKIHQEKMGIRYEATLEQGIDFTKPGYPLFLKNVTGISNPESWGRWSDAKDAGPRVVFEFNEPLPNQFILELAIKAYGPNKSLPIKVIAGKKSVEFSLDHKMPNNQIQIVKIPIELVQGDGPFKTIEIIPAKPTAPPKPQNFNPSNPGDADQRSLGVGLKVLAIHKT